MFQPLAGVKSCEITGRAGDGAMLTTVREFGRGPNGIRTVVSHALTFKIRGV